MRRELAVEGLMDRSDGWWVAFSNWCDYGCCSGSLWTLDLVAGDAGGRHGGRYVGSGRRPGNPGKGHDSGAARAPRAGERTLQTRRGNVASVSAGVATAFFDNGVVSLWLTFMPCLVREWADISSPIVIELRDLE